MLRPACYISEAATRSSLAQRTEGSPPPSLSCVVSSYFIQSTQHHGFRAALQSPAAWIHNFALFLSKSLPCQRFCFLSGKMTTVLVPVSSGRGED